MKYIIIIPVPVSYDANNVEIMIINLVVLRLLPMLSLTTLINIDYMDKKVKFRCEINITLESFIITVYLSS